jgi:crotonobetainyl-CoA:carnitine CoA-transferase CaiB-like acyl-CoA transferase
MPIKMDRVEQVAISAKLQLSANADEVLGEFGLGSDEIAELRSSGVVSAEGG